MFFVWNEPEKKFYDINEEIVIEGVIFTFRAIKINNTLYLTFDRFEPQIAIEKAIKFLQNEFNAEKVILLDKIQFEPFIKGDKIITIPIGYKGSKKFIFITDEALEFLEKLNKDKKAEVIYIPKDKEFEIIADHISVEL